MDSVCEITSRQVLRTDIRLSPTLCQKDKNDLTSSSPQETESTQVTVSVHRTYCYKMGPKAYSPPGILRSTFPHWPWYRLPNFLTYLRCIAVPIFLYVFVQPNLAHKNWIVTSIFALASITDYLDGALARRWDITSPFGAFLDPVADKLMISTVLILLSGQYGPILSIPSAIILAREIAVSSLREWMAQRNMRDAVKVGFQGKLKTAVTMISLTILLLVPSSYSSTSSNFLVRRTDFPFLFWIRGGNSVWDPILALGLFSLYVSTLLTVTSGSVYFKAASSAMLQEK